MEVLEKTNRKVVLRQRSHKLLRTVVGCLLLAFLFYLLDARHPKSSLYCTRHAVLPDNELEAAEGLHVEDIDCSLIVRPTRTALDLTFFGEISYSFEIVSARLVRPPKRPPDATVGISKRADLAVGGSTKIRAAPEQGDLRYEKTDFVEGFTTVSTAAARESDGIYETTGVVKGSPKEKAVGGGRAAQSSRTHHSLHRGVNDVATLVLEDNQGITYDFYAFQDEAIAERTLDKVDSFICEARKNASPSSSEGGMGAIEQSPLELEVLYDDSWLDEMACGAFLLIAVVLMTRPFTEVVEFDAESGAMALDRWNLFQCGIFRYSCALENVSKLEITEADVYMMSAHAFEHLRQTKEFGLRVLFSVPLGQGRASPPPPPAVNSSATGTNSPFIPNIGSSSNTVFDDSRGTTTAAGVARSGSSSLGPLVLTSHVVRRSRQLGFYLRKFLFRGGRGCGGRRPITRSADSSGGLMYLELLFGRKALDDRKLRRPVELVNDLLLRFANDVEGLGGKQRAGGATEGNCCVCFRRRSRVVTFPCMHMATCPQCSESLNACPLCRASISEKHTVFL